MLTSLKWNVDVKNVIKLVQNTVMLISTNKNLTVDKTGMSAG